jgi:hypothetical protein
MILRDNKFRKRKAFLINSFNCLNEKRKIDLIIFIILLYEIYLFRFTFYFDDKLFKFKKKNKN